MILVVFGTTGELIKLAPVLTRLDEQRLPYLLATTGQQVTQIPSFLDQFGLPQPAVWLARGRAGADLATNRDIPFWLSRVARSVVRHRRRLTKALREGPGRPLVLVHGDTMTTVIGAMVGRLLGVSVAHIEGGLRSGDIRNPFPEELNRRATSRLAHIHYAPGSFAVSNLQDRDVVDTGTNTVRDSLELVPTGLESAVPVPDEPFGIVSLHRFELLNARVPLAETLEALAAASLRVPLLFVDHPVTRAAVRRFELDGLFAGSRMERIGRLRFFDFVQLERRCAFVVTDSGGSQEECYYLDRPCLVHRRRTERVEGIGENVVVSGLRTEVLLRFLEDPGRHRRRAPLPSGSPSDVVVADLVDRGFAAPLG